MIIGWVEDRQLLDGLPWWQGIALRDYLRRRALVAPIIANKAIGWGWSIWRGFLIGQRDPYRSPLESLEAEWSDKVVKASMKFYEEGVERGYVRGWSAAHDQMESLLDGRRSDSSDQEESAV